MKELHAEIGVIAVPTEAVAATAAALAEAGVVALLNFASLTLAPMRGVIVKNVDLTLFLENLSFQLGQR